MSISRPVLVDLTQYVNPDRVVFLPMGCEKKEALRLLAEATGSHPGITDGPEFTQAIYEREEVSSTGIGGGIAVPHAKLPSINGFVISVGVAPQGIDFAAKDDQPVYIMVMIGAAEAERDTYLRVLATVAGRLKVESNVQAIRDAQDPAAVLAALIGN